MKNLLGLIIVILFSLPVLAQSGKTGKKMDLVKRHQLVHKTPDGFKKDLLSGRTAVYTLPAENNRQKALLNGKQKLDSVVTEMFDEEQELWLLGEKEEYTYDNNGNLASFIYFTWDVDNSEWIKYMKEETVFDDDGNMTLYIFSAWDETGNKWMAYTRSELTYEGGQVKFEQSYYWDEDSQEWLNSSSLEYEYQDGLLTSITLSGEDLNGDDIINELDQMRFGFFYDQQGNLIQDIIYMYPDEETGWVAIMKSEYTYISGSQVEQVLSYYIDDESGEWVLESRELYAYNSFGIVISESYDFWDNEMGEWQTNQLWEYNYNDDGDLLSMILSDWDYESGSMVPNFKNEYTHNTDYSFSDLILPYIFPPDYFAHMITTYSQSEYFDGEWVMTHRGEIFYSDFSSSGISVIPAGEFALYPNPASDMVTFTGAFTSGIAKIELHDMNGKRILVQNLPTSGEVSLKGLKAGIYFYRISDIGVRKTGRLVIK